MSVRTCSACGAEMPEGARFCLSCGRKVGVQFCQSCGDEMPQGARFCLKCGREVVSLPSPGKRDKRPEPAAKKRPPLHKRLPLAVRLVISAFLLILFFAFFALNSLGLDYEIVGGGIIIVSPLVFAIGIILMIVNAIRRRGLAVGVIVLSASVALFIIGAVIVSRSAPEPTPAPSSAGQAIKTETPAAVSLYTNPVWKYSIQVIEGWTVDDTDKDKVLIKPRGGGGGLVQIFSQATPKDTLESYVDRSVSARLSSWLNYQELSRTKLMLPGGLPAYSILAKYTRAGEEPSRSIHLMTVKEGRGLELIAMAWDARWDRQAAQLEKMAYSVVVGDYTTTPAPTPIAGGQLNKGKINVGPKVEAAQKSISPSGGTITVDKPGEPLNGFKIEVPANSYKDARTFKVSYAPVKDHTFGTDFNPISPLISVDNGGGFANEVMLVKIPAKVPKGNFAMAFFYDANSGTLEGIPLVAVDDGFLTVATRHFTDAVVSYVSEERLKGEIVTGFKPGADDWQFPNNGSYIEPFGQCAGQSIAAMWYYYEKTLKGASHLYKLYDNNFNKDKTPKLWQDDSLSYRFASTIQSDINWDTEAAKYYYLLAEVSPELTWRQFAYALLAGEPQYVGVLNTVKGGGHALVVYKISNGTLYVADPNYPGNLDLTDPEHPKSVGDRKIEFFNGKYNPYNSGANLEAIRQGEGKAYDQIVYYGKTAFIDWEQISKRWGEFQIETIGDERFPAYTLEVVDDSGATRELKDGFTTDKKMLNIRLKPSGWPSSVIVYTLGIMVYRDDAWLRFDAQGKIELKEDNNHLGIWVRGKVGTAWKYVDFKWVNVFYKSTPTPTPTPTPTATPTPTPTPRPTAAPAKRNVYSVTLNFTVNQRFTYPSPPSDRQKTATFTVKFPDEGIWAQNGATGRAYSSGAFRYSETYVEGNYYNQKTSFDGTLDNFGFYATYLEADGGSLRTALYNPNYKWFDVGYGTQLEANPQLIANLVFDDLNGLQAQPGFLKQRLIKASGETVNFSGRVLRVDGKEITDYSGTLTVVLVRSE